MRLLALLLAVAAPLFAVAQVADPVPAATAAAAPPAPAAPAATMAPTAAVVARLAEGDRLALAGDPRNALFAYLDAVYAQPSYLPARLKAGRAYLSMRYPGRALEQAELVLAADPENAEAKRLLEEARAAASRIGESPQGAPGSVAAGAGGAAAAAVSDAPKAPGAPPAAAAAPAPAAPRAAAPRVFKLTPEPAAAPATAAAPERPAVSETGAQRYRNALGMLQSREWAKAIAELDGAIEADPKLAVAWSARGSAQFGLGKYKEAAEDYRQAIALDAKLGTPVYGLAECYRQLGERSRAAETYRKYAESTAPDVRDDLRALAAKRAQELR